MAPTFSIAFLALTAVALATDLDGDFAGDKEFRKRDPVIQEFVLAEKRESSMKKYKMCDYQPNKQQECLCSRRSNKFLFCSGRTGWEAEKEIEDNCGNLLPTAFR